MKTTYLLYISLTSSFVALAQAKPLSYVGGTMVMQENDETGHTLSVDYTFDPHFALGIYAKYELGGDDFWMAGPQLNTLIKRWNLPEGQGNIFNMTGAGMARQGSRSEPAAWTTMMADYETRRVFAPMKSRFMYARQHREAQFGSEHILAWRHISRTTISSTLGH